MPTVLSDVFNMAAICCNCGRRSRSDLNVFSVVRQGGRGGMAGARLRVDWLVVDVAAVVDLFPAWSALAEACVFDGPMLLTSTSFESRAGSASVFLAA